MPDTIVPRIDHSVIPRDGRNVFQDRFGPLPDADWAQILDRSMDEPVIDGVHFPRFPGDELQNQVHGNAGTVAMGEAVAFYRFVKDHTYRAEHTAGRRLLDFGTGWGRMLHPFMRDFAFVDLYGFEADLPLCALARMLNPYACFLTGPAVPAGQLPAQYFDFAVSWSVFSHFSPSSAVLWLRELARILVPGGRCVFTTWGERFLRRLLAEQALRSAGQDIHWYSAVCLDAAGSVEQRLREYQDGEFVWFTNGQSTLYGEAFLGEPALRRLLQQNQIPLSIDLFDRETLSQDAVVLTRL